MNFVDKEFDMICNSILDAMGNTPIIRLRHMVDADSADILVKFEGLNVGGSIKTRTAFNMINEAEKQGKIGPDTIIVEPTSGNQGIGLALVGAVRGYKVKIHLHTYIYHLSEDFPKAFCDLPNQ